MAVTFTHDVLIPQSGLRAPRVDIVQVSDIYGQSVGGGEAALARQLGIEVVNTISYNPNAFNADGIARQIAADRADFLWDVSYLDDGVALWQAIRRNHVELRAAVGTSSAFCMPDFALRLGADAVGVYAADKPDDTISNAALSATGRDLLARARAAYAQRNHGEVMEIPAVAGFVGAWALFHDVLPEARSGAVDPDAIAAAARSIDLPDGSLPNGAGLRFSTDRTRLGQNERSSAVIWQWHGVGQSVTVWPPVLATGSIAFVPLPR